MLLKFYISAVIASGLTMLLFIFVNYLRPGTFPLFTKPYVLEQIFILIPFVVTYGLHKHYIKLSKVLPKELLKRDKGPYQKILIELHIPYNDSFAACVDSLHEMTHIKYIVKDEGKGEINALIRGKSPKGSIVRFKITRVSDNITQVILTIKPVWFTVIFDEFVNLKTAESLYQKLKTCEK